MKVICIQRVLANQNQLETLQLEGTLGFLTAPMML